MLPDNDNPQIRGVADNVEQWLEQLGLGKYIEVFTESEIDSNALPLITVDDLKEIGIPVGARRKMLAAIAELHDLSSKKELASEAVEAAEVVADINQPSPPPTKPAQISKDASLRQVTIVFIDIVGSTALSQKLDPETMRDVIRKYQDVVAGVILRFGGHVAKFLGDGVLAYFGWPQAYEDQTDRAVHAALDAITAVQGVKFDDGLVLQSRVGIATGEVVVGDLLGDTVIDTDAVIGETPNLAARLQGESGPDELVICATTLKLISQQFRIGKTFKAELKGFDAPVNASQVLGIKSEKSRFDQRKISTKAELVGRNHELGLLLDRWEQACNNEGQVVILSGDAGIGKSRLVQALLAHPDVAPTSICHLQCSQLHNNSPFYPIIQHLENLAGIYSVDDIETRAGKLDTLFDGHDDMSNDSRDAILSHLDLPLSSASNFLNYNPEQRKILAFRAVRSLLISASDDQREILVLEDAHWIDPTTEEFFSQLVADFATTPILMLATHRPGWVENWSQTLGHASTLSLGKLPLRQVSQMVIDLLGGPVSVDIINRISERADGNPLYIEEIAKSTLNAANTDDGARDNVPETLQASLLAQIDNLSPTARSIAQAASVIGREFGHNLVLQLQDLSENDLQPAIDEMITDQIIQNAGSTGEAKYIFRHALIQETIYNSLLRKHRKGLHKNVADAIISGKRDGMRLQNELVARHYEQAGLPAEAIPHWRTAGVQACSRASVVEATQFFTYALKLTDQLEETPERLLLIVQIMNQLGKAQNLSSKLGAAIRTYLRAAELAKKAGAIKELVEAAIGLELSEFYSGKLEYNSSVILPEVLEILGDDAPLDRCRVQGYLGRATCSVGHPEKGYKISIKATEMARQSGNIELLMDTLSASLTLWHLPQNIEQRVRDSAEFTMIAEQHGAPEEIFRNLSLRIAVVAEYGDAVKFNELIDSLDKRIRTHQIPLQHWVHTCSLVMREILHGNFKEAENIANQALAKGQLVNRENAEGVYGVQMFTIRREQGRLAEIAPFIKKITDENPDQAIWKPGLALIASELGFMEPAAKIFNELAANNFLLAKDAKLSTTLSYLAEVCARLKDKTRAAVLYDMLVPYRNLNITIGVTVLCIGSVDRYLGLLAMTMEEFELADQHFKIALQMNRKMDAHPWLAHSEVDYATLLSRWNRSENSNRKAELIKSAETIATKLGMTTLLAQINGQDI